MKIRICKSFAQNIWKTDLDKPSTRFDGCGLLAEGEENQFEEIDSDGLGYIIPSKVFNSFEEFINQLKIPYYEDYEVVVVNDGQNCFNHNNYIKDNIFIIFLLIIFILL